MTILETQGLTKKFGDLVAVDEVDLEVSEETIHSVIGPNGAGKSTLFNLITGMLKSSDGQVFFEDQDITGLSSHEIARRGVARSFQITDIFEGLTVAENVRIAAQTRDPNRESMWRPADSLENVTETTQTVLEDVGLSEYHDERADTLGHGDRRKLEIGLTIAAEPRLLLLDEPTAGMGKEDTIATIQIIQQVAAERDLTLVLIEHDLEVVMGISDRVTVLHNGAVIAEGTPAEVQDDKEVQEAYLGSVEEL